MSKILVVEDESALQKTMGAVLRKEGYEVLQALDGEIGLQLAQSRNPDLVILDLILPKVNGFEILEKLKANPQTKYIPVIILTNLEAMEDVEKALNAGACTYLIKANYTLEEVLLKVRQALAK